jgi:hypothetical protein
VLILEGPDGGGKTTLMHTIMQRFPQLTVHPKFVPSTGVADRFSVYEEVIADTERLSMKPIQIYDRHPLISEYVYGPVVRGYLPHDWQSPSARMIRSILANHTLVIWCMPVINRVRENAQNDPHKGVSEHIDQIYSVYQTVRAFWPGRSCLYDYQNPMSGFVFSRIESHIQQQTDLRNGVLDANPTKEHAHE